jgi:hypothetical protein
LAPYLYLAVLSAMAQWAEVSGDLVRGNSTQGARERLPHHAYADPAV